MGHGSLWPLSYACVPAGPAATRGREEKKNEREESLSPPARSLSVPIIYSGGPVMSSWCCSRRNSHPNTPTNGMSSASKTKRASVVAIKTATSRPVLLLWTIVSLTVAILCTWSYSQPAWTLRSSSQIGSLSRDAEIILVDEADQQLSNGSSIPGRSAIPLVHIGLFGMCIYTQRDVICVTHAELDNDWLPPAWQVNNRHR